MVAASYCSISCICILFFISTRVSAIAVNESTGSTPALEQAEIPSIISSPENPVRPTCFPPDWFPIQPEDRDCLAAARLYRQDRYYDESIAYERHPVPGIIGRKTPVTWVSGSCGILIDANPGGSDVDAFNLSSGWSGLSSTILECIIRSKPGHRYGGCVPIGNNRGFFVAVGGRPHERNDENGTNGNWTAEFADFATRSCGKRLENALETT